MSGHTRWRDIRAGQVAHAGGESAVQAAKDELLAEMIGHRLAEVRKARGLTQQQVAERVAKAEMRALATQQEIDALRQAQNKYQQYAQQLVDQGFNDLDRQTADAMKVAHAGHNSGDLWRSIAEQLNAYRVGIQERARGMYDNAARL